MSALTVGTAAHTAAHTAPGPAPGSGPRYSAEQLLDLWTPSPMPDYLAPFALVASSACLQPVTLLPIEARRQYTRSFKARPKKSQLASSAGACVWGRCACVGVVRVRRVCL